MTLDEAILHARSKAECGGECAAEHAQLAEWLEELRELKAGRTCECVAEYAKSPFDGETIVLHRCSGCHELMRPHMLYCPSCGRKVQA